MTTIKETEIVEITETTIKTSSNEYPTNEVKVDYGENGIFDGEEFAILFG